MKKLFAILMLTVYLFNLIGHSFFFSYYINLADEKIYKKADNNEYSDAALKEIKIKLNLPYLTDWSGYERYNGEIEVNGVHYNYVKRKVFRDTLFILCLPNEIKTELYKTKTDYAIKANDLPSEKQSKNPVLKKGILSEAGRMQMVQYAFTFFDTKKNIPAISSCPHIPAPCIASVSQPPEFLS